MTTYPYNWVLIQLSSCKGRVILMYSTNFFLLKFMDANTPHTQKLLKFADTSHVCKGEQDSHGHWLVTGATLDLENRKIFLLPFESLVNAIYNYNTTFLRLAMLFSTHIQSNKIPFLHRKQNHPSCYEF
eukprot:TRINITY_DN20636_c0_g2_i1.p1 TRINITY_DN20636_c0_g2~~TRINITY_DN20636_c0_g2_i1.p1  ORF type:complete len:129 (-),score=12.69 TRINITY_DN20636_c0_g2_i1:1-387(-)